MKTKSRMHPKLFRVLRGWGFSEEGKEAKKKSQDAFENLKIGVIYAAYAI